MTVRGYVQDNLSSKASALTYSTVLAVVPLLAVIVGFAKGFGVQDMIADFLYTYLPSHHRELKGAFDLVDNYLAQVKSGLFIGIGLIFLFYTVFNLLAAIETVFNDIWESPRGRSIKSKVTGYFSMLLLLPVIITVSSGITLMMSTLESSIVRDLDLPFFTPMVEYLLGLIPFVLIIFSFVGLFIVMPNVRVKFVPALIAGTLAGIVFQVFQMTYINGMLWISRYNAIYGSFAAFPLLLLWVQLTWVITLFAVKLCYAIQNVRMFDYDKESSRVSHRYKDFFTLVIAASITQRFIDVVEDRPHSPDSLSNDCRIPARLVSEILRTLLDSGVIVEVNIPEGGGETFYHPALDPEKLSVGYLLERLDRAGSENFKVDRWNRYSKVWEVLMATRTGLTEPPASEVLLKDIPLGERLSSQPTD